MRAAAGVFRGIRPVDWVLAGALTALGILLMVVNVLIQDAQVASAVAEGSMVHQMTSHSWAMVPVFALASVPVLWWRRNVLAVTGIALAVMVLHDLLFGWVTRCGAGLPLAFVLAYLGAVSLERRQAWIALALTTLLTAAVLVVDSTTGFGADRARAADRADRLRNRPRGPPPHCHERGAQGAHGRAPAAA